MKNNLKNKIIDRAIQFIENPPDLNYKRMAAAYIEELKLIKKENVFPKEPRPRHKKSLIGIMILYFPDQNALCS